ncbi:hypothetical protein ACFY8S_04845 [Streptomyces hygroscopicus]|uniref:SbtR family transcriptional regulator n=1 Tax=Streptomyces hygroscopicus TaxID=1912 RepID=UPI0036ACB62E
MGRTTISPTSTPAGFRSDIGATDLFAALTGIALASGQLEQREQADRLLDLTLDGLSTGVRRQ